MGDLLYVWRMMRCLLRGQEGFTREVGEGDDWLCLGFRHATVSTRLVLQLARLTDVHHRQQGAFTSVGEGDTLRWTGEHSRLLKWACEDGPWHHNYHSRGQARYCC